MVTGIKILMFNLDMGYMSNFKSISSVETKTSIIKLKLTGNNNLRFKIPVGGYSNKETQGSISNVIRCLNEDESILKYKKILKGKIWNPEYLYLFKKSNGVTPLFVIKLKGD